MVLEFYIFFFENFEIDYVKFEFDYDYWGIVGMIEVRRIILFYDFILVDKFGVVILYLFLKEINYDEWVYGMKMVLILCKKFGFLMGLF